MVEEKKFDQGAVFFKEALQILKKAKQEKSLGYVFILKKLAYICYRNNKYADAEKYFEICT